MYQKQGFTLIELLVVVLIIGILSSVALPQYQRAVAKSRFAGLISLASSIGAAEQAYYMANGVYTTDADDLDISLPGGFVKGQSSSSSMSTYNDGTRFVTFYAEGYGGFARVALSYSGIPAFILWGFSPNSYRNCGVDKRLSAGEIERGKSICSTYGAPAEENGMYYYYNLH